MSSLKSLLAIALAACAFPNAALAYIDNISAPTSASAGQSVPVSLHTSIYIQNYNDFGVIWGLSQPAIWCPNCVGLKIGYTNFGWVIHFSLLCHGISHSSGGEELT